MREQTVKLQEQILEILKAKPAISIRDLAAETDRKPTWVHVQLQDLEANGRIRRKDCALCTAPGWQVLSNEPAA